MQQLGITQAEAAKKAGVTPTYLSQILRQTNENPAISNLEAIADALGFTLAELVTDPKEFKALTTHKITDCFERVGEILGLMRDGHYEEAYRALRKKG